MNRKSLYRLAGGAALLCAGLGLVPHIGSSYAISVVLSLLVFYTLAQSWDWVGGELGYVNLAHFAFYGIGAYAFAIAYVAGAPFILAILAAIVVTAFIGIVVSLPLFRLRGDYFAFGTLALLPLAEILALNLRGITNGAEGIVLPAENVTIQVFYLMLVLAFGTFVLTYLFTRSRFGLIVRSIRNDEEAAESIGVRALPTKIAVLVMSAIFAGAAGAIHGWYLSFIDPRTMFGLDVALVPIAMALLGGTGLLWGPLVGVIVLTILNQWLIANIDILHAALYGLVIVLVGRFLPGGMLRSSLLRRVPFLAWLGKEHHETGTVYAPADVRLPLPVLEKNPDRVVLECRAVRKTFGGNVAVNDVNLKIRQGEIVGLIGANGSGKTTLFNCISRIYPIDSGDILVYGQSITHLRKDQVAHNGIGRTYQIPRSFEDLTVRENIATALLAGRDAPSREDALKEAASFAVYVGLGDETDMVARSLSLQKRKALELGRALASKPTVLLVDEVASGLTSAEIIKFVNHIKELRDVYGLTIIWVEHIFSALSQAVDRVVVLEQGNQIADGTLGEILEDQRVRSSYFGTAEVGAH